MEYLTNLVPSPSTQMMWVPRPASIVATSFDGFTTPAQGEALFVVGNVAYGMIASAAFTGKSEPFAYNILTNAFYTITGPSAGNLPTTEATTGDWVPPTMALIGTKIIVTHPGFSTGTNKIGWLDIATPTAPVWSAGTTTTNALVAIPVAVANFNGRAYYAVPGNGIQFSDSGVPLTITNASQALRPYNGLDVTAFGGLPVSQLVGGALQALIAFQGDAEMQQITGDPVTNNLALNSLNFGAGTLAPNTICATTKGLMFVSPDGVRILDFQVNLSDPIGANGKGINVPFVSALNPSRMCAAFNQNVYRVSVQNAAVTGQPTQEWWFDFSQKVWSGPHTFPAALIEGYQAPTGSNTGHGFILFAKGINAKLWTSLVNPTAASTYTENGAQMLWAWQTILLPDNSDLAMNSMVEASLTFTSPPAQTINIFATDEQGHILDQFPIVLAGSGAALWGVAVWGVDLWGANITYSFQTRLPWTQPIVFKQLQIMATGVSATGVAIGNLYMRHEELGYQLPYSISA
jgi:hypothetical protein